MVLCEVNVANAAYGHKAKSGLVSCFHKQKPTNVQMPQVKCLELSFPFKLHMSKVCVNNDKLSILV